MAGVYVYVVVYDRSFIVLANGITIVNYARKDFIVQAPDLVMSTSLLLQTK
jgi:hypothetical protein